MKTKSGKLEYLSR